MSQPVLWLTDPAPTRTSIFLTPFKEWDATEPRSMSVAIGSEHPMECVDVRSIRRNRPGEATARLVLEEKDFVEPWRRLARNQRGTRQND